MLLTLFITFFKIGLFTIGGGYAMIPLIEREVVERKGWISREDFLDLLAIAQSAPGVFAVNISIFIGYRMRKSIGSIFCALGTVLPSIIIILSKYYFFLCTNVFFNFVDYFYIYIFIFCINIYIKRFFFTYFFSIF